MIDAELRDIFMPLRWWGVFVRKQIISIKLKVCVLVNNLGATTMLELMIANRKIREILNEKEIEVHDTLVGSYCTSLEMAGFSISLLKLDDDLQKYYDLPTSSAAWIKG
jgi:dihydroxyacetone kinase-like protein